MSIGKAALMYTEEQWWLKVQVLFFRKKWTVVQIIFADRKKARKVKHLQKKKGIARGNRLLKFFNVVKTFRVTQWKIAISSGDNARNALLYPLNFLPHTRQHVDVNFIDENYLVLTIRNQPWRIIHALMK